MSDEPPIGVIIIILFPVIFGAGVMMGSRIGDSENYETGRNVGIIFCAEKKQECMTEYNYLKLKEKQK
jgi:hypothetical protein